MKCILLIKSITKISSIIIEINTWLLLFRRHLVISYIGPLEVLYSL